jgi:hypothetical protein
LIERADRGIAASYLTPGHPTPGHDAGGADAHEQEHRRLRNVFFGRSPRDAELADREIRFPGDVDCVDDVTAGGVEAKPTGTAVAADTKSTP